MKIDFHTHILPPTWPDMREKSGYGGWIRLLESAQAGKRDMMQDDTFFRAIDPNCFDVAARLPEMQETGVDAQVICTVPVMFAYWAKAADALYLAKFLNDDVAQTVADRPRQFLGLGTVPLQDIDASIAEMARCRDELGMRGIQIGSHINGTNLDDPGMFRFFEAAEQLDMAIVVHPWDMLSKERMQKYWGSWLVGMPTEVTMAITTMIFGGVFDRLPKLRVCFGHGGGSFPFTVGRIQHGWDCRPDLVALKEDKTRGPREYLGHFWVDSITHDEAALRYILALQGEDKVILGSDYPFPLGEWHPGKMIEAMPDLSPALKTKLLHTNGLRFLGYEDGQWPPAE